VGVIQTVLGPIAPDELGPTQTHEHVICDQREAPRSRLDMNTVEVDKTYMILDDYQRQVKEVRDYYAQGGRGLVEVTTSGWGRDVEQLARVSQDTGVHIVACGGFYIEPCLPTEVDEWSIEEITKWLVREITEGVGDTGIRVGLLKSGIYRSRIEGPELKGLRAVARASVKTGAAITTHTTGSRRYEIPGGNMGRQHLRILKEEGVSPDRLIVGHIDERPDVNFLSDLAAEGCYIQFDTIGKPRWMRDETRVALMRELIRRGHLDRILMSTDRCRKAELYKEMGGLGYTHIFESFVGTMRRGGMAQGEIDTILTDNPARALTMR